jgi:arylsulfatase A-like enzyme
MPWFQAQLQDRTEWLWFANAVVDAAGCPSRATIPTGQYDTHTHVRDNTRQNPTTRTGCRVVDA